MKAQTKINITFVLVVLAVFIIGLIAARLVDERTEEKTYVGVITDDPALLIPDASTVPTSLNPSRPSVSLVPGGVNSLAQMRDVTQHDKTLGKLFANFNWSVARCMTFPEDFTAFVSFRRGDKILWSKRPILITHGSAYCTDGVQTFLMRCGNLIRFTPQPDAESEDIPDSVLNEPPVIYPWHTEILTAEDFPDVPNSGISVPVLGTPSVPVFGIPGGPSGGGNGRPTSAGEPSTFWLAFGPMIGFLAVFGGYRLSQRIFKSKTR